MLYPVFALVVVTLVFVCIQFFLRVQAVRTRKVHPRYFKVYHNREDAPIPDYLVAGQKHFANMFETPVLFYVVAVLAIALNVQTPAMIFCGWLYVGLRVAHAVVHSTYNHVIHRMLIFWAGLLVLLSLWIMLMVNAPV